MSRKRRLIDILRSRFPDQDRERLLALVLCGEVFVAGERCKDPKTAVSETDEISIRERPFVSRGGEKLDRALSLWGIDVRGKVVLDAGASTGGFTDCLLRRGAVLVHAVDVGSNQLHPSLLRDPRVLAKERTNVMGLDSLDPEPHGAVCDLSFRSLRTAATHILELTSENWLVALVKPQFEWRNPPPSFDGVVRSTEDLEAILKSLVQAFAGEGVVVRELTESPIRGASGNREFLFLLSAGKAVGANEVMAAVELIVRGNGIGFPTDGGTGPS